MEKPQPCPIAECLKERDDIRLHAGSIHVPIRMLGAAVILSREDGEGSPAQVRRGSFALLALGMTVLKCITSPHRLPTRHAKTLPYLSPCRAPFRVRALLQRRRHRLLVVREAGGQRALFGQRRAER